MYLNSFNDFLDDLKNKYVNDLIHSKRIEFIHMFKNLILDIIKRRKIFLLDNLNFQKFRYVEYKDFILDLFNQKIIEKILIKGEEDIVSFKYYNYSLLEMFNMLLSKNNNKGEIVLSTQKLFLDTSKIDDLEYN